MSEFPASKSLLDRVIRRLYIARIGHGWYWAALGLAAIYALLLMVSRLTGVIPDWFSPPTVGIVPIAALLVGLLWMRRPSAAEAARHVDAHEKTHDLYLTLTMLDDSSGDYKPLVCRDAEAKAAQVEPRTIVPWSWGKPLLHVVGCLILLAVGSLFVPALDPFGKVAQAKEAEIRQVELQKSRKATEVRKSQLARSDSDAETSEDVKKSLEDLQNELRRMEPKQQQENARVLAAQQKSLGEKWRLNADQLKQLLSQKPLDQRFGTGQPPTSKEWLKQLQEGKTEALDQELEELQKDLLAALDEKDPVKRTEAMRRLQNKLGEMQDFAREQANSKPLAAAMERAMKQLEAMKSGEMSKEASEAVAESMKLASMELKQLAQSMRDLKQLEQALEALQMAKKLNSEGNLDGEACEGCESMGDYAELYAEMMAEMGYDVGMGTGAEGLGEGGEVPEDESAKTEFKDETSKSTIQKGKLLLSIKTKGVSESDDEQLNLEYQAVAKDLKQSVSEAIEQEQIPPGYHDGIKKYFDSLDKQEAE